MVSLIIGPFGFLVFKGLRRERKLLTEGLPAAGLVTECTRGSRAGYRVKYEFRTEDGSAVQGRCEGGRRDIDATVCVLYLRQDPRQNMLYSKGNYCVVE
jgi:hypothetical protein